MLAEKVSSLLKDFKIEVSENKLKYLLVAVGVSGGLITAGWVAATRRRQRTRKKNITRIIDTLGELQRGNIYIRDRDSVEEIVCQLIKEGDERLQIIVDFDMTITKFMVNGRRNPSSYGVIDCSDLITDEQRERFTVLKNTYYPIEISPDMSIAEKTPYMVEWWTKAHKLVLECNLTKERIRQMVKASNVQLRDGCDVLFARLAHHKVPLLVFSAGIGDTVEEIIRSQDKLYENIKVVSNYLEYNAEGNVAGFRGQMIHIYNKNESAIHKSDYFEKLKHRHNIILLGDSLGDLRMADGANAHSNHVLKIGFLNDKVEHRLEEYMDKFDIVICQDESMDVVTALLNQIL